MSLCWGVGSLAGPVIGSLSSPCGTSAGQGSGLLCGEHGLLAARCAGCGMLQQAVQSCSRPSLGGTISSEPRPAERTSLHPCCEPAPSRPAAPRLPRHHPCRPYFLPCLVAGLLSAVATVLTITHLDETLPSRRAHAGGSGTGSTARYAPVPASEQAAAAAGAAAVQGGEVELQASLKHRRGDVQGLGGLADGGTSGSRPGSKLRAFRGDSARMAAVGSGGIAGAQRSKQPAVEEGGGSFPSSPASSGSEDDFVVFSAVDLEAAPASHPPESLLPQAPWYRQRACITTLVGYGETLGLATSPA